MSDTKKTAVIVGAGPAGLNLALLLANRGFRVQVFDKRVLQSAATKRTYIISISPRGAKALTDAGVNIPQKGQRVKGLAYGSCVEMQAVSGKVRRRQLPPNQFFCERQSLIEHMVSEIERLHPEDISLHFEQALQAVDFDAKEAIFVADSGKSLSVHYDLLVGADGVNSGVRAQLQKVVPELKVEKYDNTRSLRVFADLQPPEHLKLSDDNGAILRFIVGKNLHQSIAVWLTPGGTMSGILYGFTSVLAPLTTAEQHAELIRTRIPQYPDELVDSTAAQVVKSPLSVGSASVKCSQYHGPAVVLIGDAAHGVTPSMGQGAVAALESSGIFAQVFNECNGDIQTAVEAFTARRMPEMHALFDMDRDAEQRMGSRGKLSLYYMGSMFHMTKGMLLHSLAPSVFRMPAILRMSTGEVTYRQTKAALQRDRLVVGSLLTVGLAAAVAATAVLTTKVLCQAALTG